MINKNKTNRYSFFEKYWNQSDIFIKFVLTKKWDKINMFKLYINQHSDIVYS